MRRHHLAWLRPALALAGFLVVSPVPALAQPTPVALTEDGLVFGKTVSGMNEFLGMRYAAPPVGALRWRPPQPLPRMLSIRTATQFGPHCAQPPSSSGIVSTSEDCLYLNVYAPVGTLPFLSRLPVMIWVHGGAFIVGESNDYDPEALVKSGNVIVVTINYRLGYLGFLADPGLDSEGHLAANYGLQDQQFAFAWVRRNIAGFGGNPDRVTIFGQSAGGASVLSNLVSPSASGLFQRAIVESGAYSLQLPSLAQAETAGKTVATSLGCASADTACLRAAPVAAVLASEANAGTSIIPIVDGTTLPLSINTALSQGRFNRVPLLNGSNHDEYRYFLPTEAGLTAAEYPALVEQTFGALAPAIIAQYPVTDYSQPVLAVAALVTDEVFACTGRAVDRWTSPYVPVFAYEFNDENAPEDFLPPTTYPFGAAHGSELQYLFTLPKLPGTPALTPSQESLSDIMVRYWTNFARASTPDGRRAPFWPGYANASDIVQSLVPPQPMPETGFASDHKCAFWQPLINPS